MKNKSFTIKILVLVMLIVYLFVSAEPPLKDISLSGKTVPIETVLQSVAAENDAIRKLYTKEIVGAGLKQGLSFGENWREPAVESGPLPALFLRETATFLEKSPVRLSLFLGSDFPINASNKFNGMQTEKFEEIKKDGKPQFFFAEDTELYTAMFADYAVADACVTCHNDHAQTPKTDWKLNEVMGATTWSYPSDKVTLEEFMNILNTLRQGFRQTYATYIEKVKTFENPPQIGDRWPTEGYYLPSVNEFMMEMSRRSSFQTLETLLNPVAAP